MKMQPSGFNPVQLAPSHLGVERSALRGGRLAVHVVGLAGGAQVAVESKV